jgi:gliding motility-associated lipoprotein GldH
MIFAFLGIVFASCDNNRYFEHNEAIVNNTWHYDDAKEFDVEIEDSLLAFNFYINVRNTVDYEFANLYFFIKTELPDGDFAQDTVECQLANYEGKWLGDGRGEFRDNRFILRQNMRFQQTGTYRFLLNHGMRRDSLKGIADVGIRLEIAD